MYLEYTSRLKQTHPLWGGITLDDSASRENASAWVIYSWSAPKRSSEMLLEELAKLLSIWCTNVFPLTSI
jgi:hypothetical protein